MADKQVIVKAKIETEGIGTLSKELDGVTQSTDGLTVAAKGADTAFVGTSDAVRSVGYALKAAGIGLIMAAIALAVQGVMGAVGMLTDAFMRNKEVSDTYEKTLGAINDTLTEVLDTYVALVLEFYSGSERFPALGKHMENTFTLIGESAELLAQTIDTVTAGFKLLGEVFDQITNLDFNFDKIRDKAATFGKEVIGQYKAIGDVGSAAIDAAENYPAALGELAGAYAEFGNEILEIDMKQRISSQKTKAELELERQAEEKLAAARLKAREKRIADNKAMFDFFKELRKDNAQAEMTDNKKLLDDLRRKHLAEAKMLKEADIHKNKRAQVQKELEDRQERELAELKETLRTQRTEKEQSEADALLAIQNETTLLLIEDLQERALKELEIQKEKELKSIEGMNNFKEMEAAIEAKYAAKSLELKKKQSKDEGKIDKMTNDEKLNLAMDTAGSLAKVMGEESAAGRAFAVTQATIDTFRGAQAAFTSMSSIPVVGPALGAVAAAAAIAGGIANVKAIMSANDSGNVSGGGGASMSADASRPTPQMMGGAFELGDIEEPEPVKAFVVTDEMTNSQDQLANIRRKATI